MRLSDTLLGLLATVLGIAILWHIQSFPQIPGHYYGPAMFPAIVAWGFILFGGLLLIRVGRQAGWRQALLSCPDWRGNGRGAFAVLVVLASIQAFIHLGDAIGFPLLSIVTMGVLFLWAGRSLVFSVGLAVFITLLLDALFSKLLRVPLPAGVLQPFWW
ncbi:tripartite tricarboxylate transporter TctB family protein [Pollutimonas sp. M17]|uniref:tripartite tricarboxylate transporter TctB family protein n=1 Tax=Pollutimonas sp. M17 TaxID=2962065 RepID=UPI0021F4DF5E|nr:tripartite tricarboxylate transporter TctB family protein [Pollutimonas sp. M17]UYO93033.1 tripartite tricarboxylate transporter TctB family protein [Pollutimonas sp. M17]HWK72534.1 tripartite tricarboxylate transporter TctB family protein [Burkholderiaceae bacterium]